MKRRKTELSAVIFVIVCIMLGVGFWNLSESDLRAKDAEAIRQTKHIES